MARDTKLGPEEITRDIPNLGEAAAEPPGRVRHRLRRCRGRSPATCWSARSRPRAKPTLTPEEKLLRAIFGEKASDVKGHLAARAVRASQGTVIDVQVFTREGIERDKRAQQIIDDELKRFRPDLDDQLRIVEARRLRAYREAAGWPARPTVARRARQGHEDRQGLPGIACEKFQLVRHPSPPKTKSRPSSNPSRTPWSKPATGLRPGVSKTKRRSSRRATSCRRAC